MAEKNYFSINRSLLDSDEWLSEPFTKGQAWVDMIGLANWKRGFIRVRGVKVTVERGCIGRSQVTFGVRWKWSRGKVERFLKHLEIEQQIELQRNNVTTLIRIINYEKYQGNETTNDTANGQQTEQQMMQQTGSKRGTNNNNNNNNKGNKGNNYIYRSISIENLPDGLTDQDAKNYIDHRLKKKAPLTQHAFDLILKSAVDCAYKLGIPIDRCINEAIEAGWTGLKADWLSNRLNIPIPPDKADSKKDFSKGW